MSADEKADNIVNVGNRVNMPTLLICNSVYISVNMIL